MQVFAPDLRAQAEKPQEELVSLLPEPEDGPAWLRVEGGPSAGIKLLANDLAEPKKAVELGYGMESSAISGLPVADESTTVSVYMPHGLLRLGQ